MVRHNHIGPEPIMAQYCGVIVNGFHDHVRQCRLPKIEGTCSGFIQQAVHGGERLPGTECGFGKGSIRRQTAMETPCNEDWLLGGVNVWQSPIIERHGS